MFHRFISCFAALAAVLSVGAAPVSRQQAAATANRFWQQTLKQATVLEYTAGLPEGLYLFAAPERGFVIVGADDVALPVLAYSTASAFDPERMPVQLQEWLAGWSEQIAQAARAQGAEGVKPLPTKAYSTAVGPLLTTLWDQDAPYNNLCPQGTVTGCAATAQAMLMKYWNHPAFGTGEHSYVHTTYGLQGADFGHTLYDWPLMPDSATTAHSAAEQQAVATLMYHVGVSLDMVYATPQQGGSAAAGLAGMPGYATIDNSLKDYFRYSPQLRVLNKGMGFTDDAWRDTLVAELDLRHPIVYIGTSAQGGHAFVCDGYDTLGLMHFNFGWSGIGNGYYAVGSITPGIGPSGSLGSYDFSSNNQALLGAVPLYGLTLSDTVLAFTREGGADSLLFGIDPTLADTAWAVSSDAQWLTVQHSGFARAGWVHITAAANTDGQPRTATVTLAQGTEQITLRVVQDHYGTSDYCPVTVAMRSRRNNGWLGGARLTLQSAGGMVYGTAQMAGGSADTVVIAVPPQEIHAVWHTGGGTDRFAGYTLLGPGGNQLLNVDNAFLAADRFTIANPCDPLGIDGNANAPAVSVYPNPTAGRVGIQAEGIQSVTVLDIYGRQVAHFASTAHIDLGHLPAGQYLLLVHHATGLARQVVTLTK